MRVLITGGAGFVGANLAVGLAARHPDWELISLDNLHRRGSELNLPRLEAAGVRFTKADVREIAALRALDPMDAIIECSAEPSALAGTDGDTEYAVHTNLLGAYNCLELARRDDARFLFLSSSRVYPFGALSSLRYSEGQTRFELSGEQELDGVSAEGISERFPLGGARTLYGATKLAAELLTTEYAEGFGLHTIVDRCGVIAGPWQMGKVDQGVFAFWVFHHHFGLPLRYIGYGGTGKQVRDLIHIEDLAALIDDQLVNADKWAGFSGNVGGGLECSLSLMEATEICRELTGNEVPIEAVTEERPGDVPIYLSDSRLLHERTAWRPRSDARRVMSEIHAWTVANESKLSESLGLR